MNTKKEQERFNDEVNEFLLGLNPESAVVGKVLKEYVFPGDNTLTVKVPYEQGLWFDVFCTFERDVPDLKMTPGNLVDNFLSDEDVAEAIISFEEHITKLMPYVGQK